MDAKIGFQEPGWHEFPRENLSAVYLAAKVGWCDARHVSLKEDE